MSEGVWSPAATARKRRATVLSQAWERRDTQGTFQRAWQIILNGTCHGMPISMANVTASSAYSTGKRENFKKIQCWSNRQRVKMRSSALHYTSCNRSELCAEGINAFPSYRHETIPVLKQQLGSRIFKSIFP